VAAEFDFEISELEMRWLNQLVFLQNRISRFNPFFAGTKRGFSENLQGLWLTASGARQLRVPPLAARRTVDVSSLL